MSLLSTIKDLFSNEEVPVDVTWYPHSVNELAAKHGGTAACWVTGGKLSYVITVKKRKVAAVIRDVALATEEYNPAK